MAKSFPINIRSLTINHGGKHQALNVGFEAAYGEWIVVIDSDDWFLENAFVQLDHLLQKAASQEIGFILTPVTVWDRDEIYRFRAPDRATTFENRENTEAPFDCTLTFRKAAAVSLKFPVVLGENFIAEAWFLHELGQQWKVYLSNHVLACAQYQADGLSANILEKRMKAPVGACLVYSAQLKTRLRFGLFSRSLMNFGRFWWHALIMRREFLPVGSFLKFCSLFPGFFFAMADLVTLWKRKRQSPRS